MKYLVTIILTTAIVSLAYSQTKRVGIGLTNPERTLEVGGVGESKYIRVSSETTFPNGIEFVKLGAGGDWRWQNANGFLDLYHVTNDFAATSSSDILATFTNSGRFGIGTLNPLSELHVIGEMRSSDLEVQNKMRVGTTSQNGRLHIYNNNVAYGSTASLIRADGRHNGSEATYGMYATLESTGSGDAYGLRAQGNVTGTGNSYGVRALAYANGSGGVAYGLHSQVSDAQGWSLYSLGKNYMSGDLRIGTTSDPYGGEYKVIVDGKILSEEVRIQNSTAWPDYVFKDSYQLLPLDELAESIEKNGHLPNIPPAEVVESDGIAVGEMQIRMMEKIEELTLYILQQQEEIEELKRLINRK